MSKDKKTELDIFDLKGQDALNQKAQQKIKDIETEKLIETHYKIIQSIAATIAGRGKLPSGVVFEDLISWGVEGLVKAKGNFDESKGVRFSTYANYRIKGEILDNIRKEWSFKFPSSYRSYQDKIKKRIEDVLELSLKNQDPKKPKETQIIDLLNNSAMVYILSMDDLGDSVSSEVEDLSSQFSEDLETKEHRSILLEEIELLEEEEKLIIKMFYHQNMTQKMISEKLKLSRSKVCREHDLVLTKLRRRVTKRLNL
ncbi:hypothetical protein DID77_02295 [Candidatus Marinamargulisbacteria bacterium SCGC AG-439-L15]|nr:hypothetical protein DID77_02295 [Candidatus Marinamargulisbacteria bacterium SCGC AG-439-L15]